MARQVTVGDDLYLFHGDEGRSDYLVISSHGLTARGTFIVPPGVQLFYYAPRGHILKLKDSFRLGVTVAEQITGGRESPDYTLTKFQGSHNFVGETYDSIKRGIDEARRAIRQGIQPLPSFLAGGHYPEAEGRMFYDLHRKERQNLLPMDVLTVRHRKFHWGGVKLSAVLRTLQQHRIFYPYVFCSFCRSHNEGSPSHTPAQY